MLIQDDFWEKVLVIFIWFRKLNIIFNNFIFLVSLGFLLFFYC